MRKIKKRIIFSLFLLAIINLFNQSYPCVVKANIDEFQNSNGRVILYANQTTESMKKAIDETNRRREIQIKYNIEHNIIPKTIVKPIREPIHLIEDINDNTSYKEKVNKMTKKAKEKLMLDIEKEMREAAKKLDFERAAELRDILIELREED